MADQDYQPHQFYDHLPDQCPPQDAKAPSCQVYYLVSNDPPIARDFLSIREKSPQHEPFQPNEKECEACGLSVFAEIEGIQLARKVSSALRKKKLAIGDLTPKVGLIKNTPSNRTGDSHHTLWPHKESKIWKEFKVINNNTSSA